LPYYHSFPTRRSSDLLGDEFRRAVHGIARSALIPGIERERPGDRRHVVGVRPVLHLRLESLALVPKGLEDRGGAVREGERPRQDLDDGPTARDADRLQPFRLLVRLTRLGCVIP